MAGMVMEDTLQELGLSFYHEDSGRSNQPDDKLLNPLSNLECICLSCAVNF